MLASFIGIYLTVQILELPVGIEPAISHLWATSGNHYTRREPENVNKISEYL
jgi:hypothetical protein